MKHEPRDFSHLHKQNATGHLLDKFIQRQLEKWNGIKYLLQLCFLPGERLHWYRE